MTPRPFHKTFAVAACLSAFVPVARAAEPPDPAAADVKAAADARAAGEAKTVALAFAKAVMVDTDDRADSRQKEKERAKERAIREVVVGTDEQVAQTTALASVFPAVRRFRAACDARFGPDNDISKGMSTVPDLVAEVEKADVRVDGDAATVVDKDKPDAKDPMKLKRVDGKWKVDLASSVGADAPEHARKSAGIVRVLREATEAVAAGKYKTALEAVEAMAPKMEKATK